MEVLYERCCGLDVHKNTVVACIMLTPPNGRVQKTVRTFGTTTAEIVALRDWIDAQHVSHIAMESTGIFWRPLYNLLEDEHTIILVNAHHIKSVPGRKTDVKDSEWIADLLRHGLLKASFIPPKPFRDVRDLMRYRKSLVYMRTEEINRLQKVLETANIKLASVATNVLGKSGRQMIEALIEGEDDPHVLTELAVGKLRIKLPQLQEALEGRVEAHHRLLLKEIVAHIDFLEQQMEHLLEEIEARMYPFKEALDLLMSIPGLQLLSALTILSEVGIDLSAFPSDKHFASWIGVCPGNKESAGKRLSGHATKGNVFLRAALAEVCWCLSRMKGNYLSTQHHRFARRMIKPKAAVATSHSLAVIVYHVLKKKKPYQDLGPTYLDALDGERAKKQAIRRLDVLGYEVVLTPKEVSA
ncbi:IS110 family transposase [Ktedonobacter robiniae]|uniref:IS110 family transposase n=2 Tax=Ktedonobacter robiniae TaxID=2778365 RepID=A0ABQ3UKM8_9CHLR|nr:IS110 family transposase [Ktedonobacter robiniae]GHO56194.1 IS110 family transposase [Ktedonobacter robiniae]GHO57671.1 IS110 family transposase [Ktedonobacter robiniae]